MEFLKLERSNDRSTFITWIPTTNWNFTIVSHVVKKITEESPEQDEILIFETGMFTTVKHPFQKEVKKSNDGKVIREIFEEREYQEPYQVVITNKDTITTFVNWLNESTIVDATKNSN